MFEMSTPEDDKSSWNEKSTNGPEVDLGAVTRPIDTEDRTKLLSCSNYTFLSRRGRPVKMIPRDEDLFVLDSKRQWDHQDQEPETEPWQVDPSATKYIITCFQSEISSNTFARHLRDEKPPLLQKEVDNMETKDDESKFDGNANADSLDSSCSTSSASSNGSTTCPFTRKGVTNDVVKKETTVVKQNDKKKKTKSLSDVLSRIKREPTEMNDLTRELFEKKNDGSKRDCENDVANSTKANNKAGERFNELPPPKIEPEEPYTNDNGNSTEKEEETRTPCRNADNEDSQNEELKPERAKDRDKEKDKEKEGEKKEGEKEEEEKKEETEAERQHREWKEKIARLKVKDPAGTLKRRRINDYEDESYSRDEASLYLVTETQDSLARRCVCLSTILRNLTFIPGNESEFAKNVTFLSILGKLLLLHHEHPVRTQKTRNYDREEDADFADSCSSLQGEGEWWWDFLYHIRENVLVMSANISGYMDLSLHPEEISRPVLDGLLHWAVCPAAHGQDPFPTVSLSSSLSPQRLALEALCKLCVTESNVDLVVATPPYSRLQRLCSVLTRLLCRSEEQPMREFAVNLLHFLSAADSGVARTIALQTPCVAHLVAFIEQAENSAIGVANQHGLAALRDNPESMGTSLDMLRRAAATLLNLARHPDNRTLLLQHESRLLALVMSQILDQQVAAIVARVLYQCSRGATST